MRFCLRCASSSLLLRYLLPSSLLLSNIVCVQSARCFRVSDQLILRNFELLAFRFNSDEAAMT